MVFNPDLAGAFVFVPGVMAMVLLLVSAMMTSVTIAREKEMGTMEVLMVSPLNQGQILFGKVLPYLLLSFLNGCIIIFLGVFALGIPLNGSLPLLLAETLLFIFLALSIGIFISSLTGSQLVAMFASLVIMLMPTIFLSGFIFPIESMPKFLQVISNIIPAKYFIEIVKGIMIKGVGLGFLYRETLVLLGMSLFFTFLSLRNLKTRLA
jgi:ABC-2 type transport system permease protein